MSECTAGGPYADPGPDPVTDTVEESAGAFPPLGSECATRRVLADTAAPPARVSVLPMVVAELDPRTMVVGTPLTFGVLGGIYNFGGPPPSGVVTPVCVEGGAAVIVIGDELTSRDSAFFGSFSFVLTCLLYVSCFRLL